MNDVVRTQLQKDHSRDHFDGDLGEMETSWEATQKTQVRCLEDLNRDSETQSWERCQKGEAREGNSRRE